MKPSMAAKLAQLATRLTELDAFLSSEQATRDMDAYRKSTREHAELTPVVELFTRHQKREADITDAQGMLSDPDMKCFV
jgi:peptide chain release factor 1